MRLIIEGAITLYEVEGTALYRRALAEGQATQAATLDTLETALRALKDHICDLQDAHMKERLLK